MDGAANTGAGQEDRPGVAALENDDALASRCFCMKSQDMSAIDFANAPTPSAFSADALPCRARL